MSISQLQEAKSFGDIFSLVKKVVYDYCGREQVGLLLGVTDLGGQADKFIGAFYSMHGNMIILNNRPLKRIQQTNPSLYNAYIFHVLLHEYIHSLGVMDEMSCRQLTSDISSRCFGDSHQVTELSRDIQKFLPNLTYPAGTFEAPNNLSIDFIQGFDRANTNYIL